MGDIYEISCECGYKKEIHPGGGLSACNKHMINKLFSEDSLKEFNEYQKDNKVSRFIMENEIVLCEKCNEIETIAVLLMHSLHGLQKEWLRLQREDMQIIMTG